MKLVHYFLEHPHKKNHSAIKRMCESCDIEYEETNNRERLKINDYDILIAMINYVDPYTIPENIKIIYGPHFFVFPSGPIVGNIDNKLEKRCVYNCLSPWVGNLWSEYVESLIFPISFFPFSVDIEKFSYSLNHQKNLDCVVYIKRRKNTDIDYVLSVLNEKQIKYKTFRYGTYYEDDYKNALCSSKFMISLDAHESQGFALEECMACNVPLLVLDAQSMYEECDDGEKPTYLHHLPKKMLSTSVPYWSDQCGIKVYEKENINVAIDKMLTDYNTFNPRQYIIDTLSDKVCMKRILNYFKLN